MLTVTTLLIIIAFALALYGVVKSNAQAIGVGLLLVCIVLMVPVIGSR